MALSGTTNKQSFSPAAGTTSLTSSLPFFDTVLAGDSGTTKKFGDIKVARETSAGVITQLTPTSGVVGADNFKIAATNGDPAQGCTVTIASSTAGDKYTVERDVAYTQEYDLQEGATIDPTALNKAFDWVVAQNQQQNDEFSRSITFPVTDADTITYNVDTSATDRAGKILGFDSNGSITELAQIQGSASVDTSRGLQLVNNQVGVKDDGITNSLIADDAVDTAQIANDAVEQAQIADNAVGTAQVNNSAITKAKIENVTNMRVLGNTSGSSTAPQEVTVFDEDDLVSNSATGLATQQSIKAYVDNKVLRSLFIYQENGDTSISDSGNTTCPLTESFSDDSSMSVSANIITLTAGTYLVKADANIGMNNNNNDNFVQGAIVDTGDSDSVLIAGKLLHSYNDFASNVTHDFSCIGKLTLTGTKTVALKFRTNSGTVANIGDAGAVTGMGTPIHATVYIEKLT